MTNNSALGPKGTTNRGGAITGMPGRRRGIGEIARRAVAPFFAAAPIMGALAGMGVRVTAGLIGALIAVWMPKTTSSRRRETERGATSDTNSSDVAPTITV